MRIALYHRLPAGGALRVARASVASTNREHSYVLFALGSEPVDPVLERVVDEVRRVPVPAVARSVSGRVGDLARVLAGERAVGSAIDGDDFDLAVFHPSQVTQAPTVLLHVASTPTLYFAQEPRRRAYEHGYQPWIEARHGARKVVAGVGQERAQDRIVARLDREGVERATMVVTNSSFSVESIARAYGRDAVLCHLGVPIGDEPLSPRVLERSLLSVGGLDPTKGHDLVVEALGLLPTAERPSLTVVHERVDPRFRAQLERRARDLAVSLTIRSNVPDDEAAVLYARATATVAAARLEPFGLTPLESMAVGTPVLAVREGGFRETVTPGVNGVLVDRNPAALAAGVAQVVELADLVEPDTVRKSVQPYWSWDRCMDDFRVLLERVGNPMSASQLRGTSRRTLVLNLRSAGVATGAQYLSYLAVAPVVFATAGEATFGAWATVSSILAVGALADAGLRLELARRVADAAGAGDSERLRRTVHEGTTVLAWVALAVLVIGCLAAPLIRAFAFPGGMVGLSAGEADLLLRATFVLLAVSLLTDGYFAVLRGLQRADVETNSRTAGLVVGAVVSIAGLEAGWGIWALLAGAAAMDVVGIVVQAVGARRLVPDVPFRIVSLRDSAWRHLLGFSSLALLSQLSDVVDSQWDKIMLSRYVGSNAVAGFQIGTTVVLQGKALAILPVAPLLVAIAELRGQDRARVTKLVKMLSSATFATAGLVLSGIVVFAPAFFRVWLGEDVPAAVTSARLFTVAIALNLLAAPLAYRALAEGRHRLTAISATTNIAVNLVASFVLTLSIGFKGPLYGSILGNAVGTAVLMVLMRRSVELRDLLGAWRAVVVGGVAVALGLLAGAESIDSWLGLGLAVLAFCAVFGPVLCWVERVPVRELLRRDAAVVG